MTPTGIIRKEWVDTPGAKIKVPNRIEVRICPTDQGHWKVEGERCPACRSKIVTLTYKLV